MHLHPFDVGYAQIEQLKRAFSINYYGPWAIYRNSQYLINFITIFNTPGSWVHFSAPKVKSHTFSFHPQPRVNEKVVELGLVKRLGVITVDGRPIRSFSVASYNLLQGFLDKMHPIPSALP